MSSKLEFTGHQGTLEETLFVDVLLPVPIPGFFTYRVPRALSERLFPGMRVTVQFGRRKIYTGIVRVLHHTPPKGYEAKYILDILDQSPSFTETQLQFIDWMAGYYLCSPGEVLNVAMPSGLKLSSESRIQLRPGFEKNESDETFNELEEKVIHSLEEHGELNYDQLEILTDKKSTAPLIKSLIEKQVIYLYEQVKEKYKPKTRTYVRLIPKYVDSQRLEELMSELDKRPKQATVLLRYLAKLPILEHPELNEDGLVLRELKSDDQVSESSIQTLVKNGILEKFNKLEHRFQLSEPVEAPGTLTTDQQQALREIRDEFMDRDTVLLHGITGSGKTEIYTHLIRNILDQGGQVLYLLPEIALTTHIVSRLRKVFGDRMGVYHSRYSANERVEVWNGVLEGRFPLVVGVRSSLFLPFDNLDLVIIDEEHDPSYKAFDPAPRYHGRDAALQLANLFHAKTLLGSATPSIESYTLAKQKKYGLVELHSRFHDAHLPQIIFSDVAQARKQKKMREDFSPLLLSGIDQALEQDEQAIIFQNRRGYAPYLFCENCHHIPQCARCSVSLTYHRYENELRCHYCGYRERMPTACSACGSTEIHTAQFGTEKLEEDLNMFYPNARIGRMDLDTTRSRTAYEKFISDFSLHHIDILIGTQMIAKGLDFGGVSLVGIMDADRMLNFPDFRSYERTFQLLTQVSGRAGRRDTPGRVIIQTRNPGHPVLQMVLEHDYEAFYQSEIQERERYNYPPYTRLIRLLVKNPDRDQVRMMAAKLGDRLKSGLQERVLGPQEPLINRIRDQYLMEIMIKLEREGMNLPRVKAWIRDQIQSLPADKPKTRVQINVDPV